MNDSQKTGFIVVIVAAVFFFSVIIYINLYSDESNYSAAADGAPPSMPRLTEVSPTPFVYQGTVTGTGSIVRATPDPKADVAFMIAPGSPVELLRRRQDWVLIKTATGDTGWMLRRDVRALDAESPEAAADAEGNDPQSLPKNPKRVSVISDQ